MAKKKNKRLIGRIGGVSGIALGIYMMYLGNKWGAVVFGIGLAMLLWRYKKR